MQNKMQMIRNLLANENCRSGVGFMFCAFCICGFSALPERRWSPRRRDRPELKNKLNSPTAVHHMVHASGDDSPNHRR
ncbi:hypothetical protein CKO51_08685 [Rhodopirellula sp. SM50]|nr:hypothetical protein CKO51_08685 [Rhodopirellula sp. SM50]